MSQRVSSVHSLRGLAAFAVVVAHSLEHGGWGGERTVFLGRFGVEVFFLISGFVITLAAGAGRFNPLDFMLKRIMRVVPLYWLTTAVVIFLAAVIPSMFKTTVFTLGYAAKSLFFIPDTLPGSGTDWRPIFKLGWTLNYEIFFYVVMAATFWLRSNAARVLLIAAVMAVLVILSALVPAQQSIAAFYLNLNLMPFILGVIFAGSYQRWTGTIDRLAQARLPLFFAALAAVYVAMGYDHQEQRDLAGHLALTASAALVFLSALSHENAFGRGKGVWTWFGDISYSLYLLHMFVVGAGWSVLNRLGMAQSLPAIIVGILAMLSLSCALATASYRLFERPLNRLASRRTINTGGPHDDAIGGKTVGVS